ncbi:MAG: hypothetical protein WA906_11515 [Pacificimonas sp.]
MDDQNGEFAAPDDADFDAPPAFHEQDERRMHVRAYNHWAGLLRGREFPAPADLSPENLDDFGPNSVLIDFAQGCEQPTLRFVGERLREECGLPEEEASFSSVPARSLLSRLTDHYFEIIANRAPVGFEAEFTSRRGNNTLYRGILMPLSTCGETIDVIYGVINWKEVAGVELEEALVREVGRIEDSAPADDLAAFFGDDGEAIIAAAATGPSSLVDDLAEARAAAQMSGEWGDRSRSALYDALSRAWDFHLAAEADPAGYGELLSDCGIVVQKRAPMTAVAKLVFGVDADKARLTEYATALTHAVRQEVPAHGFLAFLNAAEGGLKGLVAAERQARRAAKPKGPSKTSRARVRLKTAASTARLSLDADGSDDFVLVIARREADGALLALETVPEDKKLLDSALAKVA